MSDIIELPLKDLQDNFEDYKGKKVRIAEFLFFATNNSIFDDYYLDIGPRGGIIVRYARSQRLSIGQASVLSGSVDGGIEFVTGSGWRAVRTVIFPPAPKMPKLLAAKEKELRAVVEQYKKTYHNAEKRLEAFIKINEKFPEYSL